MNKKSTPDQYNLSLIQVPKERDILLAKMRGKLAGRSQFETRAREKSVMASRAGKVSWAWKIALVAVLIIGNGAYFLTRENSTVHLLVKRAPTLAHPPADLDLNKQALYWTYALYDFDRFKSTFGATKNVIVDGKLASERLAALLPGVDARTRHIIGTYLPRSRRNS